MRVLLISCCPPWPLHYGDRLIVYHLIRELSTRGVQIDLLAFAEHASDWSLSEQQPYTPYLHNFTLFDAKPRPLPELGRRMLFPSARFPKTPNAAFAPELFREIQRRTATGSYDLAHLFGGVQVYEFAHALGNLPALITPYESYSLYLQRAIAHGDGTLPQRLARRLRQIAAHSTEHWMYTPYAATTVVSQPDADTLHALNPALNVEVIPNGIDPARFTETDTPREPDRLLFLGNYDYAPNLDAAHWLATEILPRVRAQRPNARLWLVGNNPPSSLTALASDAVEVTGRVPDVTPYLARATVFVCPLRVGAGIKNKVLEALAAGCPVVATPLSADGIAATDGEHLLLGNDADALAAQTVRLLTNADLRTRLSTNGRTLVRENYTWTSVAARYLALYRQVASTD